FTLFANAPAIAGSLAWVISPATLQSGPGNEYKSTGRTAVEGERITVERCRHQWCAIKGPGGSGWMDMAKISFGLYARGPLSGPKFDRKSGGPGQVCFYENAGYSGRKLCGGTGFVIRDLARAGFDNRLSS